MENRDSKSSKTLAVVALVLAVASLSIGFAVYSSTLTISSSATVTPDKEDFDMNFTPDESGEPGDNNIPPKTKVPDELDADDAVIDNSGENPKITGLHANFTAPGQSVTYEFYISNDSAYDAYLNSIIYSNAVSGNAFRKCTPSSSGSNPLVQAACEAINVKVKAGEYQEVNGSQSEITGQKLQKDTTQKITVTIEYSAEGPRTDEKFDVTFGDITLTYGTAD